MNSNPPPSVVFLARILGKRQIFPVPTAAPSVVSIADNSEENCFGCLGCGVTVSTGGTSCPFDVGSDSLAMTASAGSLMRSFSID